MADTGGEKTSAGKTIMGWVGGASAVIGLVASLYGGYSWFQKNHAQQAELKAQMAVAEGQAKQGEYADSVKTYGDVLKGNALYAPALDGQLKATMLWVENFHVVVPEGQSATDVSGPALDQIIALLDAGFTRTKGTEQADVQAHLGWAHWLNRHIAEREFGPAAEQNFRAALASDATNVYANAMLGNWLLQTRGNFAEAIAHLDTAVATEKARPWVRSLQLGGLLYGDTRGVRAELMKAANDMRKGGEPLDEGEKKRILSFCCNPTLNNHAELVESLSAVPADDAWKTYLWLDDGQLGADEDTLRPMVRDFIQANLLEISGKRPEALEKYRTLRKQLTSEMSSLKTAVDSAIARLS